jgi:hypothetical protein
MNETRELLERVGERFAFPEHAFEGLQRRRGRKRRNQRISAGVLGIAIFVTMVWLATTGGPLDRTYTPAATGPTIPPPSPSPASPPSPSPGVNPFSADFTIGRHSITVEGVPFSFRVPTWGWEPFGSISINKSSVGPQGAEAIIVWTGFPDGVHADPCTQLLSPPVGPSAADLAAAVATAPGTELVTGPSDVTVGGRAAKHVVLTVREDVGCDPGFFFTWEPPLPGGAMWEMTDVGYTINVWIVDVDGTRLFIEAETTEEAGTDLEHEIQQIIESIRFE